jgi:hypothetical protein
LTTKELIGAVDKDSESWDEEPSDDDETLSKKSSAKGYGCRLFVVMSMNLGPMRIGYLAGNDGWRQTAAAKPHGQPRYAQRAHGATARERQKVYASAAGQVKKRRAAKASSSSSESEESELDMEVLSESEQDEQEDDEDADEEDEEEEEEEDGETLADGVSEADVDVASIGGVSGVWRVCVCRGWASGTDAGHRLWRSRRERRGRRAGGRQCRGRG